LLGHPSSRDLKPGSQLPPLRPRDCSFANIRTARYQTDGSREDCYLCSRVKRAPCNVDGEDFHPKPHQQVISIVRRVRDHLRQTILKSVAKRSPEAWTDLAGVKPNGQQSTALWICSNDVLRGRSSPIEKTIPTWPRHACKVLCVKGGCVGGSPIGAFKGLWLCAFAILVQSQVGIQ
jgi:hypothetical protein